MKRQSLRLFSCNRGPNCQGQEYKATIKKLLATYAQFIMTQQMETGKHAKIMIVVIFHLNVELPRFVITNFSVNNVKLYKF